MCTTGDEVYRLRSMFCKMKYTVSKIKILINLCINIKGFFYEIHPRYPYQPF